MRHRESVGCIWMRQQEGGGKVKEGDEQGGG